MADENKNLIPDKWDRLIGGILLALDGVMAALLSTGVGKSWIPIAVLVLSAVGKVFTVGLFSRPGKS